MPWSSGYQLRILKGNQQGLVIPLTEQTYILGRATSQGETAAGYMFFYEPTVSRVHAELRWNEKKKVYLVHHQSKTNPTLVEGVPVDKKTPRAVEKGHKIQMGYLVLEMEPLSNSAKYIEPKNAPASVPTKDPAEAAKTHKMMVGNILEALSNLSQERANTAPAAPAPAAPSARLTEARTPPRAAEPEKNYLERDYGASEQGTNEIQFTVAQGPDKGEVFTLREQVGVIGRLAGREDARLGRGVLLNDDSLPREAAFVVWQGRDQAYGLSESDAPGVVIRVRRAQRGQSLDLTVNHGPPVLLQDGDIIQIGRSALVVRTKTGMSAGRGSWGPAVEEMPPAPVPRPPIGIQPRPGEEPSQMSMPSPWGRPAETSPAPPQPRSPIPLHPSSSPLTGAHNSAPVSGSETGGIVPRNFPGSGRLPLPERRPEPEPEEPDYEPPVPTFRTPPPPARVEATLIGRASPAPVSPSTPSRVTLDKTLSEKPARPESLPVHPGSQPPPLDPTTAPTLGTAGQPSAKASSSADDRHYELVPLSWPWRDNSDFVFDFASGPNRGRQIALNAAEMHDDRVITLGSNADQFDIPLDGTSYMAALRYRSRRFALLNQGPDDSVQVNRVPLKRGDQVVLMTGDRIDIGESCFRFLERAVVEVLQGFQIVVESGVDQDQDKVFPFSKQRLLIGRGKNCDVRLTDLEVSRIHVALVHRDGKFFVQHRSETNPTFLNGMSLLQGGERALQLGDRIRLSSLTLLQFAKAEPRKRAHSTGR